VLSRDDIFVERLLRTKLARIVCDTDARICAYKMDGEIMTTWRENGGGMAR
jgi:hypothetical protein